MMGMAGSFPIVLGMSAAIAVAVAVVGGLLTDIGPWYLSLRNPAWKPPDWAFGPIWTVIWTMIAISAAIAWHAAPDAKACFWIALVLAVNYVLNISWSAIFFKVQRPDWALIELVLLWFSIVSVIFVLGYYSSLAGLLMIPYLLWVSTAGMLNYRIVQLNQPFG